MHCIKPPAVSPFRTCVTLPAQSNRFGFGSLTPGFVAGSATLVMGVREEPGRCTRGRPRQLVDSPLATNRLQSSHSPSTHLLLGRYRSQTIQLPRKNPDQTESSGFLVALALFGPQRPERPFACSNHECKNPHPADPAWVTASCDSVSIQVEPSSSRAAVAVS